MSNSNQQPERLQKIIAQAGLASRRAAEEWIAEGLVTVNGAVAKLGDKATLGIDAIKVKGKLLSKPAHQVYYLFYKPKHVIAMVSEDEEGRTTIEDMIHKQIKERVFTVGRMDYQGEGAILLTNDGDLAQKILKSDHIIRRYHVKVDRLPTADDIQRLSRGGRIEGRSMTPSHVQIAKAYAKNSLIEISFEGMGQIDVRKFFENKGFFPERVARVGIGHIQADKMVPGTFRKLEKSSVEALLSQPELAKRQIDNKIEGQARRMKSIQEEEQKKQERKEREEKKLLARGGRIAKPAAKIIPRDESKPAPRSNRFERSEVSERPERSARTDRRPGARPAGRSTGPRPDRSTGEGPFGRASRGVRGPGSGGKSRPRR